MITTYTGKHIDPLHPHIEEISIRDIAHALSLITRGGGHVHTFFSVASHCLACAKEAKARGYSKRLVLACLLHDGAEAYLLDIPSPIKAQFPEYKRYENNLQDMIYTKFLGSPLNDEEKKLVKEIDKGILYYDLKDLLNEIPDELPPTIHITIHREFIPFEIIEKEYLECYTRRCL